MRYVTLEENPPTAIGLEPHHEGWQWLEISVLGGAAMLLGL